jgi:hypothetical protein
MAIDGDEAIDQGEADETATETGRIKLTPNEALDLIQRGEPIRDARISRLRLRGEFTHPVVMERVELIQPNFDKATFLEDVTIAASKIVRPQTGHGCRFEKGLDLRGSTIVKAVLRNLQIGGPWRCDQVRILGRFQVVRATFGDKVRFWDAKLAGWCEFHHATFAGEADFRSLHADEGFKLVECRFEDDVLFRGATFCKRWDAGTSHFAKMLDLSRAKLHDFAYLESIETGPDFQVGFHNAVAERILVRTEQVEGKLASERAGQHDQAMHEYGLLKRIYEGLHRYEQEDWAFYRFKVNQRRSRPRSWRRPWTKLAQGMDWLLLDVGCGYGTNPLRAVLASGIIMILFGLIYMVDVAALPVDKPPFPDLAVGHPLNRVMIGALTSVSVFTSGFGSIRDSAQGWMNLPLVVESLLGTLLWGLFIVAFSRKVIR